MTGARAFGTDWRPTHAYIPGRTPRHPEALFDPLKAGVDRTSLTKLAETDAWRFGINFLREGYFWEAHELLEPIWMACPPNSAEKLFVQGIIQIANARLKRVMDRPAAAARLEQFARDHFDEASTRAAGAVARLVGGRPERLSRHYRPKKCIIMHISGFHS